MKKKILIIGAGPAGLAAGYRLIDKGMDVTILEADPAYLGGISRTVEYKGYRFDIGGHRFFSKNQEVMGFWDDILKEDFLKRPRLSRWYYRGKFFQYPIKPFELIRVFGIIDSVKIVLSYLRYKFFPIKPELSLADWCINNFGFYLAKPFFLDYNQKLWGVDPHNLSKDFTQQRIKGISFSSALKDALMTAFRIKGDKVSKSLIDKFNYPKLGPGMMWEKVARLFKDKGGKILMDQKVYRVEHNKGKIVAVYTIDGKGKRQRFTAEHVLSTMPLKELVMAIYPQVPGQVSEAAKALEFRDFITVALMLDKKELPKDNWIYTHDEGLRSIRIQLFKNWSPFMVPDESKSCVGFEYVCSKGDDLWNMSDKDLIAMAGRDIEKLGFATSSDVIDAKVVRLENVYPSYLIGYEKHVAKIKRYLTSTFIGHSLQPMGRGGLHRYNNSDHSMMTAFLAVKNILGKKRYDQWQVNSEAEYHEEKMSDKV